MNGQNEQELINYRRSLLQSSQKEIFPYTVEVCGTSLEVDRGVFSPKWFESSSLFCDMFPNVSEQRVLDMGCGCGAITIQAALSGASASHGVDIAPEAIVNTRRNAERLGVSHVVRAWQSDLFDNVSDKSQYDVAFWNPPWVFVNVEISLLSDLEKSVFDPGYIRIERFLRDAPTRMSPTGCVLLGFGDFGNRSLLMQLIKRYSYSVVGFDERIGKDPDRFTYFLFELVPSHITAHHRLLPIDNFR